MPREEPCHSLSLFTFKYSCMRKRTYMYRIFTNTRARLGEMSCAVIAPPPFGSRVLPDRPGRSYRRRTDYHFNVWRPFRRAHSNLLARVRIFIKKGTSLAERSRALLSPSWLTPLAFPLRVVRPSVYRDRPPSSRDELLYGFLSGEAERGERGTTGD